MITDYAAIRVDPSGRSPLKPYLLLDPEDDKGVDLEFLSESVKRFEEDDSIKPAFIAAVEELSRELSSLGIGDDYKPYVTVCLHQVPIFLPRTSTENSTGLAKPCSALCHCFGHY
jgi:hypothetical protein